MIQARVKQVDPVAVTVDEAARMLGYSQSSFRNKYLPICRAWGIKLYSQPAIDEQGRPVAGKRKLIDLADLRAVIRSRRIA